MKKARSPVYRTSHRGKVLSFFMPLLGAAVIALVVGGLWQLLDPVDYVEPPSSGSGAPGAESQSQSADPGSKAQEGQTSSQPQESSSQAASQSVVVGEGEWLASDYFDDALFVGDSITEGIKLYDVMSNTTVLASTGVNLDSLYTKEAIKQEDGTKIPILEATKGYHPGKIYVMMGVNSLLSDAETFRKGYGRVIDTLKAQHPDATLYIQSILPVTAAYEKRANAVADNAKIDSYNEILKALAEEKGAYYLNVAEIFKDENGCLPDSASPSDGIHFGATWYRKWFDYLRTHGISTGSN